MKVGLSSGRVMRRSYRRVVETLAAEPLFCTLAMSASFESAFVAAVARIECTPLVGNGLYRASSSTALFAFGTALAANMGIFIPSTRTVCTSMMPMKPRI
jgi:hypothetical protein